MLGSAARHHAVGHTRLMEILGAGLLASGFERYRHHHPDVVVFAKGVARSSSIESAEFSRESSELSAAIGRCRANGRRLVYFSSAGAIYGGSAEPKSEASPILPKSAYGRHQASCEAAIRNSSVRHLIVRLPNVVGCCGNRRQLIPALIGQCLSGRIRVLRGATRDLIGLDDMARIVDRLLEILQDSDVVQVASGISSPVEEIVEAIQASLGTAAPIDVVPDGEAQMFVCQKLRGLLDPHVDFPLDYPVLVLRRYVPEIAERLQSFADTCG